MVYSLHEQDHSAARPLLELRETVGAACCGPREMPALRQTAGHSQERGIPMSEHRTVVAGEAKQVKSGTAKTGRPYTLIALHDGSGKQVGTCFGGSDPHKAWEASKGCTVDVELEENGEYNGHKRFNVVAVEVHREPVVAPVAAPQGNGRAMPLDDAMRMSRCCGLQYSAIAHAQRDTSEDDIMAFARRMA